MNWERLFAPHILERGYDYYVEEAVDHLEASSDKIIADVCGTDDYEVEISVAGDNVTEMFCSCPYAEEGNNCKHMAAVLYAWSERKEETLNDEDVFQTTFTKVDNARKAEAVKKLVEEADIEIIRSYLTEILCDDEKLLMRFHGLIHKNVTDEDVERYIRQVDKIADRYLGRDNFINYYEADGFIAELGEILDEDVRRMIDNGSCMSAFKLMNHIFVLIGDVDMDDSDGGTGMLADQIYQLWMELIRKVSPDEKKMIFRWFVGHLDGSVIDYLEEYIEQIIMEEFNEDEFMQPKLSFIEDKLSESKDSESEWTRSYHTGKWAMRYLELLEKNGAKKSQIEQFCEEYWDNSSVRRYYIELCIGNKEYDKALDVLNESILKDKDYRGLVSEYSKKKKDIYRLRGNTNAYIEELRRLLIDYEAGNIDVFRELKKQYTSEEWQNEREKIFQKLPKYAHIDVLFKEEQLYDRLLEYVLHSTGLYAVQQYENILGKEYPEQILMKYKNEVNNMALHTSDRKRYQQLVSLLRRMKEIKGGSGIVDEIAAEWKARYKNRPAMMDELRRL